MAEKERQEFEDLLKDLYLEKDKITAENEANKNLAAEKEAEVKKWRDEAAKEKKARVDAEAEIASLLSKIKALEDGIRETEEERIVREKAEAEDLNDKSLALNDKDLELNKAQKAYQEEIKKLQSEMDAAIEAEKARMKAEMERTAEEARKRERQLQSEINSQKKELDHEKAALLAEHSENDSAQSAIASMQSERDGDMRRLKEEIEALKKDKEGLNLELDKAREEIGRLERELAASKNGGKTMEDEISSLKTKMSRMSDEITKAKSGRYDAEDEIGKLKGALEALRVEKDLSDGEASKGKTWGQELEIERKKRKVAEEEVERLSPTTAQLEVSKAELETLKAAHDAREKEFVLTVDEFNKQIEAGAHALSDALNKNKVLEERCNELLAELKKRKHEGSAAHWRLIKYNAKVSALNRAEQEKAEELQQQEEEMKGMEVKWSKWRLPRYAKEAGAWKPPKKESVQDIAQMVAQMHKAEQIQMENLPGMITVNVEATQLKPSSRSFLSYDAYVVCELADASILEDAMGEGFWSDETFAERRGKTQGGKKTSVVKDTNSPAWDETLILPTPPVANTVLVVKVFDYHRIGEHVLIAMGAYPCKDLKHTVAQSVDLTLKRGMGQLQMEVTFLASALSEEDQAALQALEEERLAFRGTDEEWAQHEQRKRQMVEQKTQDEFKNLGLVGTDSKVLEAKRRTTRSRWNIFGQAETDSEEEEATAEARRKSEVVKQKAGHTTTGVTPAQRRQTEPSPQKSKGWLG